MNELELLQQEKTLLNNFGIMDGTTYDDCEVRFHLNSMDWLEIIPIFDKTDLEIVISTNKHSTVVYSSVDKIIVTGGNQIIGENKEGKRVIEIQKALVDWMYLRDTYLEIFI